MPALFQERWSHQVRKATEEASRRALGATCPLVTSRRGPGTGWLTGARLCGGFSSLRVILILRTGILALLNAGQEVGLRNGSICM